MSDTPTAFAWQAGIEVLGFEVVGYGEPRKNGIAREEVLSRRFTVKQAAMDFAALVRVTGREAWVREVLGAEFDPGVPGLDSDDSTESRAGLNGQAQTEATRDVQASSR